MLRVRITTALALGGLTSLLVLTACPSAHAAGFGFSEQNARANGMAVAYTAIADDPSAVFYNPGGLGFLRGIQLSGGVTFANGRSSYESSRTNNDVDGRDRYVPVPHGFGSMAINDLITVGGGVFAPYGLELSFPRQGETRYSNHDASIRAQYLSAAIAIKPNDYVSIGAVFHYVTTRRLIPGYGKEGLRVNRSVDLAEPTFEGLRGQLPSSVPDSAVRNQARAIASSVTEPQSRLKGDGDGLGYSLGILLKPFKNELLSVGFTYRSEVNLRGTGDIEFAGVQDPIGLPPGTFTNSLMRSKIRTSILLPPSFAIGVASQLADKVTLSANADWTGWSTLRTIDIRLTTGSPTPLQELRLEWADTWALRVGVEYLVIGSYSAIRRNSLKPLADEDPAAEEETDGGFAVAVRAGYAWDESPIPEETVSAFLPDNDRHIISVGAGLDMGWVRVDASFQYFYFETRRRDNATEGIDNEFRPTQGKFETQAFLYGVSATLRF